MMSARFHEGARRAEAGGPGGGEAGGVLAEVVRTYLYLRVWYRV